MTGAGPGRCPLFVELCCGSAAVTLRLIGGDGCRPPVSYMGSKQGYARAILHVLGLRAGQGADAVVLNDPGPWSRAWRVLVDPEGCRRVAEIVRGWIGEDARALWERLRAEPVPDDEEEAVARWVTLQRWAFGGTAVSETAGRFVSPGFSETDAYGRDRSVQSRTSPPQLPPTPDRLLAVGSVTFPPGTRVLGEDAARIDPREVARWCYLTARALGRPSHGFAAEAHKHHGTNGTSRDAMAARLDALPRLDAAVSNLPAEDVRPKPPLPEGTVVLIDPPYLGDGSRAITGYAHEFPRASVVEVARRWADAGARVCVCECVPVPELVEAGWRHVEITSERAGPGRPLSAQSREWLTLSHAPAWTPPVQAELFAGAPA